MREVLISIQPKWCALIASGEKTVEVRKTKPKLDVPFKVYIYCTKGRGDCLWRWDGICYDTQFPNERPNRLDGKVIGEFLCDRIIDSFLNNNDGWFVELGCLTQKEIDEYQGDKAILYGWHITDLVVYDEPRELSDFEIVGCQGCRDKDTYHCKFHCFGRRRLKRPPQSWCYIEPRQTAD